MKECHIYSNWYPRGYERDEIVSEFEELWKEIKSKEIPDLPKFFNVMITYIESNMDIKSDSEKDKHLCQLMNIYAFLSIEQKQNFLVEFCNEITEPFQNFWDNYLSISKEKSNLLCKQLCVLDMILEHASGGNSLGAIALKTMLNK